MTEAEWLASANPDELLLALEGKTTDRKRRLFACACCRRIWPLLVAEASRTAVETAERFADGAASAGDLEAARGDAEVAHAEAGRSPYDEREWTAVQAALAPDFRPSRWSTVDAAGQAARAAGRAAELRARKRRKRGWRVGVAEERAAQVVLLCDIFGNPFSPTHFDPAWRTENVVLMARGMYESQDFSAMAILGDALQDGGCDNEAMLNHCRGPGPHVRGCHVVDLVLGKT